MKKLVGLLMSAILLVPSIYGAEGEMSCFGGITPGIQLKTMTEMSQPSKKSSSSKVVLPYKENIYLSGKAETVEGTVEMKPSGDIDKEKGQGVYTETYKMTAQNAEGTVRLSRNLTLETKYLYEAERRQTTKVTTAKKWTEIITVNGQTYKLDDERSHFTKSILEDHTPGVLYYSGNVHYDAVYSGVSDEGASVMVSVNAPIYGYEQAYAKTETQKRSITITLGNGQGYAIEETPTFTVYRDIQYGANEPEAMSMAGNYKEIIRREGVLSYQILQGSPSLYEEERVGMLNVAHSPTIEQLSLPNNLNLKGNPAETQIKKMYSLKIFEENPYTFSTKRIVTKKEYVAMLVKALRIPLPEEKSSRKATTPEVSPFMDIKTSDPYYPYMRAAYDVGLVDGGWLNGNSYLTREILYVLNIKAIGLQRLGLGTADAYTPFIDDQQITAWAKGGIYAASKLGLITPQNGYVFPKKLVTQAECATFLNQLIDYLRYDLQKDYNDKMLL